MHQEFTNKSNENRKPFPNSSEVFRIDLDYKITTYELRFSDDVGDISYVTGLYHFDRPADGKFNVVISDVEVLGDSTGEDSGNAAYGNVSYRFAEQWELGLGARYDDIQTKLDNDIRFLEYVALVDDKLNFDHVSWSVKLNYYLNDNLTLYAAVDNAFKQGGFNPLVPAVFALEEYFPQIAAFGRQVATYDDETTLSYEVGIKGILLDNRLRFSADVFYQTFQDHQIGMPGEVAALGQLAALFNSQIANADRVYTQGIEFDATYLFAQDWEVALRGAYSDPTIDKWNTRLCEAGEEPPLQPGQSPIPDQLYCPRNGDSLNGLPRWQTNLQLGYEHALTGDWSLATRLNWTWQSKPARQVLAETNKPDVPDVSDFDEPKSRVDLSLSLLEQALGLELKLWVKNITDEDLNVDPTQYEDTQTLVGLQYPGREYGFTASYTF
jgi:iron complex outermembrane receptor protein